MPDVQILVDDLLQRKSLLKQRREGIYNIISVWEPQREDDANKMHTKRDTTADPLVLLISTIMVRQIEKDGNTLHPYYMCFYMTVKNIWQV